MIRAAQCEMVEVSETVPHSADAERLGQMVLSLNEMSTILISGSDK